MFHFYHKHESMSIITYEILMALLAFCYMEIPFNLSSNFQIFDIISNAEIYPSAKSL